MYKIYIITMLVSGLLIQLYGGSFAEHKASCGKGNLEGCYHLGTAYSAGKGVRKNLENAQLFLKFACDGGVKNACVALEKLIQDRDSKKSDTSTKGSSAEFEKYYQDALGYIKKGSMKSAKKALGLLCDYKMQKACNKLKAISSMVAHDVNKDDKSTTISGLSDESKSLKADLDHDGKVETVSWRKFSTTEFADYYQLVVLDDDGTLLWKSPQKEDETNAFLFFTSDVGSSLPQVLLDIGNDGRVELLVPVAQSDVSPVYFQIFSWTNNSFRLLAKYALLLDKNTDSFVWKKDAGSYGIWIDALSHTNDGHIKASVMGNSKDGIAYAGKLIVEIGQRGASIREIIAPIEKIRYSDGVSDGYSNTMQNQTAVVSTNKNIYRTRISRKDHYNSRGKKLRNMSSVLRQDRANYYKYGGDAEDQRDRYFSTVKNRAAMERIRIKPVGITYRALRDTVLYGTPLLEIEIESRQLNVRVLEN